jgi:UDP-GlcNAc:undecaprenyl-phosphate/decaprenyl-phosphate GlcNAc-1-phosphate transferase
MILLSLASLLGAFICSALTIRWLQISKAALSVVDIPNNRSLHKVPTPRVGGVGVTAGVLVCFLPIYAFFTDVSAVLSLTILTFASLFVLSILDDVRSLSVKTRLFVQVGLVASWLFFSIQIGNFAQTHCSFAFITVGLLVLLGSIWAMNLYNFMDGSDGLVACITVTAFGSYSLALYAEHDLALALTSISVCGATLGFLVFNWPPAKIFLGDAGSIPLGFLAAAIGVIGVAQSYWKPTFPLMLFAMFWIDATYTLARRAFRGEKVWQAHNEHWYQKAIRAGNSHRKILLIHLVCNSVIAGLALLSTLSPTFATPLVHILTIGAVIAIAFGFGVWAESQFRGFQAKQIK